MSLNEIARPQDPRALDVAELRAGNYNATLTECRSVSPGLRMLRIEPDEPMESFVAGQYVPVGLGLWEPRSDGLDDGVPVQRRNRLVSRPYSISCPMVEHGELCDPGDPGRVELFVALVEAGVGRRPALLTPRLWLCRPGDRLWLGPKPVGRYILDPVGPDSDVLFLATGTGEAPHTAMVTALARCGHRGRVTVMTTARNRIEFGYEANHRDLEARWDRYRYVPLSTREPGDGVKRRIQDVLRSPDVADWVGFGLDPDRVQVFLCGNPAMVGRPAWDEDRPEFPEPGGAIEILHRRGFSIDRKRHPGNVHFEAYW